MDYFKNISYLISHLFLMLFIYLFVTHRYSERKTTIICFSSFMILNISDCLKLNLFPNSDICYFTVTLLQIFVTQFTCIFISRSRDAKVLFMGLTASNYVIAGSIASSIIHIYTGNAPLSLIGGFIIHLAILLFLFVRIRNIWLKYYEREYMKDWRALCLIPVFFYCGFSCLAFFPYSLYDYPNNSYGTIIFIITMFASYITVFRYVESESGRAGIFWKNKLFETYIKGLESQYHLVEQSEKNLKILRHDMRHYSNMIDTLLSQGEYAEIGKITEHIKGVTDDNKVVRYCDNIILHSILSQMMEKAASFSVHIHLDAAAQKDIPVNDYELAAVVANLIENALICVKDFEDPAKRLIDVKIRAVQEYLLVRTKNAYGREILFDSQTGLPKSAK